MTPRTPSSRRAALAIRQVTPTTPRGRRKSKTVNGVTNIFVEDTQGRALLDYDGNAGLIQSWYVFAAGPNDVLNQVNVPASPRATYIPDIQVSIIASLDASSGVLTKCVVRERAKRSWRTHRRPKGRLAIPHKPESSYFGYLLINFLAMRF